MTHKRRKFTTRDGIMVYKLPRVIQRCLRIIHKKRLEDFTVEEMIGLLKDGKFRNIPSDVGLGQMFRLSPIIVSDKKVQCKTASGNKHLVSLWRLSTEEEFLNLKPNWALEFKGVCGEEYDWTQENYVRSNITGRT